jgi:two-component system KDP operon response regulator KdpE
MNLEKPQTVLVVDDEPQIRRLLRLTLESAGYRILDAANGNDGLIHAAQRHPDLILLDLGLPDADGVTVLKRLREWSHTPVIILTVRDQEDDKISALDAGADDYVTKPFGSGELLARIRAALRHANAGEEESQFQIAGLRVDLSRRTVHKNEAEVRLTPTEYSLLRLLILHSGKVLTHRFLLTEVWGPKAVGQTQYLRVHIAHLREKIEDDPSLPKWILTEPAIGYRLLTGTSDGSSRVE